MPRNDFHFIELLTTLGELVGWTPLPALPDTPTEAARAAPNWLPILSDELEGILHEGVERPWQGSIRTQTRGHL